MTADQSPADDTSGEEAETHPRGTFFLMLCFLVMIAVMWTLMYVTLLRQG